MPNQLDGRYAAFARGRPPVPPTPPWYYLHFPMFILYRYRRYVWRLYS